MYHIKKLLKCPVLKYCQSGKDSNKYSGPTNSSISQNTYNELHDMQKKNPLQRIITSRKKLAAEKRTSVRILMIMYNIINNNDDEKQKHSEPVTEMKEEAERDGIWTSERKILFKHRKKPLRLLATT